MPRPSPPTMRDLVQDIVDGASFDGALFGKRELKALRSRVRVEGEGDGRSFFVECVIRKREVRLNPEEVVRQLYAQRLIKRCPRTTLHLI